MSDDDTIDEDELDEELDGKLDLSEIRAEPIDPVVH